MSVLVLLCLVVFAIWLLTCLAVLIKWLPPLVNAWGEPMLRFPVLLFESDDWGPGPATHAHALKRIDQLFQRYRDVDGHPAVMTLGLTLSIPCTGGIKRNPGAYHAQALESESFSDIVKACLAGRANGTFALQLHGESHFMPEILIAAAHTDSNVSQWLRDPTLCYQTELLPSILQSRWNRIAPDLAAERAGQEVRHFHQVFGFTPKVTVPPTFVWNSWVEQGWIEAGVSTIVTPGSRYSERSEDGGFNSDLEGIFNGMRSATGACYMVRNRYFEPFRGHTHLQVLEALSAHTCCARPTLLETHRCNFVGDVEKNIENAFFELEQALKTALSQWPALRFMSTEQLATLYTENQRDPLLFERSFFNRYVIWYRRIAYLPKARYWRHLTGLSAVYLICKGIS